MSGLTFFRWLASSAVLLTGVILSSVAWADATWSPGSGAVDSGTSFLEGMIDSPAAGSSAPVDASFVVSGWLVDQTAEGWTGIDEVDVYVGRMDGGGTLLAKAALGDSRPDVAASLGNPYWANAGFDATVPTGALPSGTSSLTVYAHTPGKGWWFQDVPINAGPSGLAATVIAPGPNETIVTTGDYRIYGTAHDTRTSANTGVGVDRVQVYLDGPRGVAGSVFLGEGYPDAQTQWSVTFNAKQFDKEPHHFLHVYARSGVTGEELEVVREFRIGR